MAKLYDAGACADEGGYEHYLELARAPVVAEETLSCLIKLRQPGLVDSYFASTCSSTIPIPSPRCASAGCPSRS